MGAELPDWIARWAEIQALSRFESHRVPAAVARSASVLVAGATSEQVKAAELRLGVRFPPSYREFLLVSNGAYASSFLQSAEFMYLAPAHNADVPRQLFPVERVAPTTVSSPVHAELHLGELYEPRLDGSDVCFDLDDEVHPPASGFLDRPGHVLHSLHIGGEGDTDWVFLDPLVVDGTGEWGLTIIGNAAHTERHDSFRSFLETYTESQRASMSAPRAPDTTIPGVLEVAEAPDVVAMEARIRAIVDDDGRSWAASRLAVLDARDAGERMPRWIGRALDRPDLSSLPLLEQMWAAEDWWSGWPSPGAVWRLGRPGDARALGDAAPDDIASIAADMDEEVRRRELSRRAMPPFDLPAAVILARWAWERRLSTRLPLQDERLPEVGLGVDDVVLAATQLELGAWHLIRALALAGHEDVAAGLALDRLVFADDDWQAWLLLVSEFDRPDVWSALDRHAEDAMARFGSAMLPLVAAANTTSPLLAARAADLVRGGTPRAAAGGLLALEWQQTAEAADVLLDLYRGGNRAALRALARRRDTRVLGDVTEMMRGDATDRLTGARCLRDLRDPRSHELLVEAVGAGGSADLVVVLGRALTALALPGSAEAMESAAAARSDDAGELLRTWADQLRDASRPPRE